LYEKVISMSKNMHELREILGLRNSDRGSDVLRHESNKIQNT
jgi:hypothetical protein